jgi:Ca2+-binding RTX toxin-like protein
MVLLRTGTKLSDLMQGNDQNEVFWAGDGDDTVYAGGGDDRVLGGNGNDILYGEAGNDVIHGDAGDDIVDGGTGSNQLFGETGDDRFMLQSGTNTVDGGEGIDTVDYSLQSQQFHLGQPTGNGVTVNLQTGTGAMGANGDTYTGIENVVGSAYNDVITEASGTINNIQAGAGNDVVFSSGRLTDQLDGGDGVDTLDFSNAPAGMRGGGLQVDMQSGLARNPDTFSTWIRPTSFTNFENVRGTAFNDTIIGNAVVNRIEAGNGNDSVSGGAGGDTLDGGDGTDTLRYDASASGVTVNLATRSATGGDATGDTISGFENVAGSAHGDRLTGDAGANVLSGLAGDDTLNGGDGSDTLDGGEGTDLADYSSTALDYSFGVRVDLTAGTATIHHADGVETDTLTSMEGAIGTAGDDILNGNDQANVFFGNDGNDWMRGGGGSDKMDGGEGSDTLDFGASVAGVNVNLETNTTSGGDAEGDSIANFENVHGARLAQNELTGSAANNELVGGDLADTIDGGKGDDVIRAGLGADTLSGGLGADTFQFSVLHPGQTVSTDSVKDFEVGVDTISFGNFTGHDGKVKMEEVDGGTLVWFETDQGSTDRVMLWGVDADELNEHFDETFDIAPGRTRVTFETESSSGTIGYDYNYDM